MERLETTFTEYYVPTGEAETEFTEKRSRFLGHVFPVSTEEEARSAIESVRRKYHDASHNCWCYLLRESGVVRYSDAGEPQGTAGQPMLGVFQKERVENVCCVVTRYFGGILLGAGGLVRAYTRSAKDALDTAGISVVRRWILLSILCPYALFERVKLEISTADGVLGDVDYAAEITLQALLPEGQVATFSARVVDLTAGACVPAWVGEAFRAVPLASV